MMKLQELKRPGKLRELGVEELERECQDITEHLMKLRFQLASGQVEDPQVVGTYRRSLARVKTILTEKRRSSGGS